MCFLCNLGHVFRGKREVLSVNKSEVGGNGVGKPTPSKKYRIFDSNSFQMLKEMVAIQDEWD